MLNAYLNHGRWVVDCSNCSGAEFVDNEYCQQCNKRHPLDRFHCQNLGCHHQEDINVAAERKAIEALMRFRPVQNRNWYPGESLADLKKENKEHGVDE